jgi:hypothetical protein
MASKFWVVTFNGAPLCPSLSSPTNQVPIQCMQLKTHHKRYKVNKNIMCKIVLGFVHRLNRTIIRFNVSENRFCFRLWVKRVKRRKGNLVELASDLDQDRQIFALFSYFHLKKGAQSSLLNVVVSLFYNSMD